MHYDIYTDGSCLDNGRAGARGGWAFAVADKDTDQIVFRESGKLRPGKQTNNRAEAEAFLYALIWIESNGKEEDLYTIWPDSQYVIDCVTGIGTRCANRDIWENIESICQRVAGKFEIKHVDSHMKNSECTQHKMNLYTDNLARIAANSLILKAVVPVI